MINMKFVLTLFFLSISFLKGSTGLLNYNLRLHGPLPLIVQQSNIDSIEVSQDTSIYPARGLALSLAIPGMGQWYAGAKAKALFFFGLEVAGWMSWRSFSSAGEDIVGGRASNDESVGNLQIINVAAKIPCGERLPAASVLSF